MQKLSKWKIFASLICTIFAFIYAIPNFLGESVPFLPQTKVNLGLDLRGGSHLLLNLDFDNYMLDVMDNLTVSIRKSFREEKLGYKNLTSKQNFIAFNLRNKEEASEVKRIIQKIDHDIDIKINDDFVELKYGDTKLSDLLTHVIEQSIEIVRMRVDSTGTKEPIIQRQGKNNILLQVPGEEDPSKLKNVLGKTAKLTFHLVDENANIQEALKGHLPMGTTITKGENEGYGEYYLVISKKPIVGGDQLLDAKVSFNQHSQPVVNFTFNNMGSKLFAEVTKHNSGKRLAIVLDNKLLSAPVINEPILGGSGVISGNFSIESANELALLLRAGALPAPLTIVEERSIGANLGADSIESGIRAGIIGFIAVIIFMTWTYGILGIFANIALCFAIIYIIALLSLLQATLTLPGIAGIILTIGMAVDANVLIYERIREELRKGTSNLYSIKMGFESAFATIADSNITTLFAALFLYIFGVGAIRGFAVTLTIGIISSMFTAIVITKLLIDIWVKYYKPKNLGL